MRFGSSLAPSAASSGLAVTGRVREGRGVLEHGLRDVRFADEVVTSADYRSSEISLRLYRGIGGNDRIPKADRATRSIVDTA